ncbi:hypothetical protein EGK14_13575 [Erwinia sp. 198]|nr:hypothetical protein EGK14_13575 [Erwinia sp. 198]
MPISLPRKNYSSDCDCLKLSEKAPARVLFCGARQTFATSHIAFTCGCLVSKQPIISNLKINRCVNCP